MSKRRQLSRISGALRTHAKVNGSDTGYVASVNEPFPANLLTRP
ncbi:hypothetical protein [Streptomyces sp. NPDC090445]